METIEKATGITAGDSQSVQTSMITDLEAALGTSFDTRKLKSALLLVSAFKTAVCLLDIFPKFSFQRC